MCEKSNNLEIDMENINSNISEFYINAKFNYKNYDIYGIIYNEIYKIYANFNSVCQMINILDNLFDYVNYPMRSHDERQFIKNNKINIENKLEIKNYDENFSYVEPNFILKVKFRQNSTWQGSLKWVKMNVEKNFVSEKELIILMTKALEEIAHYD